MKPVNFPQLDKLVFDHYNKGEYRSAYELLAENASRFPEHGHRTYNWMMCLAALTGDAEAALVLFAEATGRGLWWSEDYLRQDPDLDTLRELPEFERLVQANAELQRAAQAQARPELNLIEPDEAVSGPYPLLIAFHGRNSNAAEMALNWQHLRERGWLVAAPQSSQILSSNAYAWDDAVLAESETLTHLAAIQEQYPVDPQRIVLAGFSQGAGLAISLALAGVIPGQRFFAVAAWHGDLEALKSLAATDRAKGCRGYFVTGLQDGLLETIRQIQTILESSGVPFQEQAFEDAGHEFPPGFEDAADRGLSYLFEA